MIDGYKTALKAIALRKAGYGDAARHLARLARKLGFPVPPRTYELPALAGLTERGPGRAGHPLPENGRRAGRGPEGAMSASPNPDPARRRAELAKIHIGAKPAAGGRRGLSRHARGARQASAPRPPSTRRAAAR